MVATFLETDEYLACTSTGFQLGQFLPCLVSVKDKLQLAQGQERDFGPEHIQIFAELRSAVKSTGG